ncbi:MAG TPA: T9SS type A sorting domain-containing protein, partial [Bacteroidales bacterium]|nr:T9SS type A sorting domain-containing protein [Bacteroidales bacterium]
MVLNPAGIVYRDNPSAMAFNQHTEFRIDHLPIPYPAANPIPHNGATNIGIDTVLSWSGGDMALFGNVYFGTTNPPPYKLNRTDTFYNPGTLEYSTTYYWRIDEVNDAGRQQGVVWSFTTGNPLSISPSDPNHQNFVIYPNPTSDIIVSPITVHQKTATIELFDYTGARVLHQKLQDNNMIAVNHLKHGLYIYKLNHDGTIYTGKVVLQ